MKSKLLLFSISLSALLFAAGSARASTYDLYAESLVMNSAKCEVNQTCSFTARVKNLGEGFVMNFPIKSTVTGAGYQTDSPTTVSPAQGATINTNDYITFSIYGKLTQLGAVTLTFSVDTTGYVADSVPNNNAAALSITVAGYDLNVETISTWPANPYVGQECYIRVAVKNSSTYNLYATTGLAVTNTFPNFNLITSSSTQPSLSNVVASGGYLYFGYKGVFTSAGDKTLSFAIDQNDDLKESSLANNTKTAALTINNPADTDLAIDSVSYGDAKIVMGQPFDITVGIKNTGKTSLTSATGFAKEKFNFTLPNFNYSPADLTYDDYPTLVSALNPGGIFHYKIHGAFSQPGDASLNFAINKDKNLVEANYLNDATTTTAKIYRSQTDADSFAVSAKTVTFASSTSAIISWKTDVKTTGRISYGLVNYGSTNIDDTNNVTDHSVTIDNLQPGAKYVYTITSANGTAENREVAADFTMPANNNLTVSSQPAAAASGLNAVISWNTNLKATGWVHYKKKADAGFLAAGSDTMIAAHSVALNNLTFGGYDYFVISTSTPGTVYRSPLAGFEIPDPALAAPAAPAPSNPSTAANPTAPAAPATAASNTTSDSGLYGRLKGKIILKVQSQGQAYYVSLKEKKIFYLGKPEDAFPIIRSQGVGITDADLAKIPLGLTALSGADTDGDGLPDAFETAIGTDKNTADTNGNGYNDKIEVQNGYSPVAAGKKLALDLKFAAKLKGKIFIQTQNRGQAWYINPADGKRYFMATPADAYNIMRRLGVGVANQDFDKLPK